MSFASSQADEPGSDRLLMFCVVGIVAITGLALGLSFLNRKQPLPSVQPAAPPVVQSQQIVQQPPVIDQTAPTPAPVFPQQQEPAYVPPPVVQPEQSYQAPPLPHQDVVPGHQTGNPKLDGLRDILGSN